jgi:hypothetical protein
VLDDLTSVNATAPGHRLVELLLQVGQQIRLRDLEPRWIAGLVDCAIQVGMVNDPAVTCFRYRELSEARSW